MPHNSGASLFINSKSRKPSAFSHYIDQIHLHACSRKLICLKGWRSVVLWLECMVLKSLVFLNSYWNFCITGQIKALSCHEQLFVTVHLVSDLHHLAVVDCGALWGTACFPVSLSQVPLLTAWGIVSSLRPCLVLSHTVRLPCCHCSFPTWQLNRSFPCCLLWALLWPESLPGILTSSSGHPKEKQTFGWHKKVSAQGQEAHRVAFPRN